MEMKLFFVPCPLTSWAEGSLWSLQRGLPGWAVLPDRSALAAKRGKSAWERFEKAHAGRSIYSPATGRGCLRHRRLATLRSVNHRLWGLCLRSLQLRRAHRSVPLPAREHPVPAWGAKPTITGCFLCFLNAYLNGYLSLLVLDLSCKSKQIPNICKRKQLPKNGKWQSWLFFFHWPIWFVVASVFQNSPTQHIFHPPVVLCFVSCMWEELTLCRANVV